MKKRLPLLAEQFTKNWLYKLIALSVALAIWVTTLQGRKDAMMTRTMEIEFLLKPTLAITNEYDRKVRVRVAGPGVALKKFNQTPQVISVNLASAGAGPMQFNLNPGDVTVPSGLKVLSVQPHVFDLDIKEVKKP